MTTASTTPPEAGRTGFVVGAVLALVAIRLVAAALVEISPDETYYLLWARFPSWSYYDHPPMGAWWIALGTAVFGDGAFGVRVVAVLSAIPTALAIYGTGRALFDRPTAERAVLWTNATFLIAVGGLLATPDAPLVMFWTMALLAFALVIRTGNGAWWLAVGLFAGLGVASKLTCLFLGLGILLCLIMRPDLRRWLVSPWLWAGGIVAALAIAPMVVWNMAHGWVTFTKQFSRVSTGVFQPEKFPEFLLTQFAVLNPLIAIFAILAAIMWVKRRPSPPSPAIGVLTWTVLPLVLYMAVHSFHEQIQGHWLAPIFPVLALAGAAAAGAAGPLWQGLAALAFPVGVVGSLVGYVAAANPGGVIPYRLDVGQVVRGWDGLSTEAEALRQKNGAAWIAATHYAVGAELDYRLRGTTVPVVTIFERVRYAFAPPPDGALLGKPALIVTDIATADRFAACFARVTTVGPLPRKSGGETIETYWAYLGEGAAGGLFATGCDQLAGGP